MSSIVLNNAKIFLDIIDYSANSNKVSLSGSRAELDDTTFGEEDKFTKPGLRETGFSADLYFDPVVTDQNLFNRIEGTSKPLTVCADTGAFNDTCYLFNADLFEYKPIGESHGEMLRSSIVAATVKESGGLARGKVLQNSTLSSTGNGSIANIGAISNKQKLVASIHATAVTGSITSVIQASTSATFTLGESFIPLTNTITETMNSVFWTGTYLFVGSNVSGRVYRSIPSGPGFGPSFNFIRVRDASESIYGITGSGSSILACGSNGLISYSSNNGDSWATSTSGVSQDLNATINSVSVYFVVGNVDTGSAIVLTSPNGVNFTRRTSGITQDLRAITQYASNNQVAVGDFGSIIFSSNLGVTWTQSADSTIVTQSDLYGVASSPTSLVAVGDNGTIIKCSNLGNLNDWDIKTSGVTTNFRAITYVSGSFYALSINSSLILKSSDDGETWSSAGVIGSGMYAMTSTSERILIVGTAGEIVTSVGSVQVLSFDQISAPASQIKSIAGPLDYTYYREAHTISGGTPSISSIISAGIASGS